MRKIIGLILLVVCLSNMATSQSLIPFEKNGKWGFCDLKKKQIIKPKYNSVTKFNHAGFSVVTNDKGLKGVIDKEGKTVLPIKYQEVFFDAKNAYYGGVSGEDYYGYYDTYGDNEAQSKIKRWMLNPDGGYSYFANEIVVVKENDKIKWFDKEGKQIFESNLQDELVTNYYLPGYSIKKKLNDSLFSLSYISEKGKVIIKDIEASLVEAISYFDDKDSVLRHYYNVKKEVGKDRKKMAGASRYACALYSPSGKEIISFNKGVSEIRTIFKDYDNDLKIIVTKEIEGGDDCAPEFRYGLFNISKNKFDHEIKYDKIDLIYYDSYASRNEKRRKRTEAKALEIVNSDLTFENLKKFRKTVDSAQRLIDNEDYEIRTFTVFTTDNNHEIFEKGKLIKKIDLPKGISVTGAYDLNSGYYDEYGYIGYNDLFMETTEDKKPVYVFRLYQKGSYTYGNTLYTLMDNDDKHIYSTNARQNWELKIILDSLNLKMIYEDDNVFNLLDSNNKKVFKEGFERIWIDYLDKRPVFYLSDDNKMGVYYYNGEPVIPLKYESLTNQINYELLPAYITTLDSEYSLIDESGKELIPATKNKLEFIKYNNEYFVKESAEVFSRLTNEMEWQIEGFYSITGKKFNGKN